jgi:hypothetical protein
MKLLESTGNEKLIDFGRFKAERSYFIAFNPATLKCRMYNKITGDAGKFYWYGVKGGDVTMSLNKKELDILDKKYKEIRIEPLKHIANSDFSADFPKLYEKAVEAWNAKYK